MQLPSLVVIASTDDNYDNRPLRDALLLPFRSIIIIFVLYYYSPQSQHIRCLLLFYSCNTWIRNSAQERGGVGLKQKEEQRLDIKLTLLTD